MKQLFFFLSLIPFLAFSQKDTIETKLYTTVFSENAPKIDGIIDEEAWAKIPIANGFRQSSPEPEDAASYKTEVKVLYTNDAIYFAARMYDNPDSINNFLTERDDIGNSDFFLVTFNNYRDGLNGEGFIVMPSGVQFDTKYSSNGESSSWNAVWESATSIDNKGWTAELKIPYSALRFPDVAEQEWGINFGREIRRKRERSYWNLINPRIDGFLTQSGRLRGIKNIKPPVRLFLFPYASSYAEFNSADGGSENYSFNAGLDVKYGLNDAFTLDMTLIPDFGQTRFDNQVLNLSQFEVQFNENRQFFTEGVELFNKAGLFYSRRIGGRPFNFSAATSLADSVNVIEVNPSQSQLLNATKISGRNKNGLGVGFFNAIENKEFAEIKRLGVDTLLPFDSIQRIQTNPLTNYNVLVLDQVLRNNSFVTFTNTNVTRDGSAQDANVSQIDLQLADKKNQYSVSGSAGMSHIFNQNDVVSGSVFELSFDKISGQLNYGIGHEQVTDRYNPNDLGFQNINNIKETYSYVTYQNFNPDGPFNFWRHSADVSYSRIYKPDHFANFATSWSTVYGLQSFHAVGLNAGVEPIETFDFYETRDFNEYYKYPKNFWYGGFFSSDYSRPFALDVRLQSRVFDESGRYNSRIFISPRFRPNDKLFFVINATREENNNEIGYAIRSNRTINNDAEIIMGRRNLDVHVAAINGSYIFNNKMALNLNLRHYWSTAVYDKLYDLDFDDGSLNEIPFDDGKNAPEIVNENISFNAFNIDLGFSWRFAPGSDINVVWKNIIFSQGDPLERNYFRELDETLNSSQVNSFSIKILYFIDYLTLK